MSSRAPLDALVEGHDAVDLLAALMIANFAGYPPPAEAWTSPSAVATEYLLSKLAARADPAAPHSSDEPLAVVDLAVNVEGALAAESVTDTGEIDRDDVTGLLTSVHRRFSRHETLLYDPAILEYEIRRLPQLFGSFDEELCSAVGIDISTVLILVELLNLRTFGWMFHELRVTEPPSGPEHFIRLLEAAVAKGAGRLVRPGLGRTLPLTRAELVSASGRSAEEVEAFLTMFATRPPVKAHGDGFAQRVHALRQRPVIDWDDRIILAVPYDLAVAIRPRLEAELRARDAPAGSRYDAHKAKWLEQEALRLLSELLEPDQLYRDLHVPSSTGATSQRDALARVDMLLIATECKGGGISVSARRGNPASQTTTLDRLVHDGVAQARSTLAAVRDGAPVTGVEMPANK